MGWKNVKEHYGIKHNVQVVPSKGICIGSDYVHDLVTIRDDLSIARSKILNGYGPLESMAKAMESDPDTLRRLIETPDTFAKSITVYTYDMGEIIEKQCEDLGWPNCTHDGLCMYENMFSADRAEVVEWARRNAAAGAELTRDAVIRIEDDLEKARGRLAEYEAATAALEKEAT